MGILQLVDNNYDQLGPDEWPCRLDWIDLVKSLKPLNVSVVSNSIVLIGWADEEISPHHFLVPNKKEQASLELTPVYTYLRMSNENES